MVGRWATFVAWNSSEPLRWPVHGPFRHLFAGSSVARLALDAAAYSWIRSGWHSGRLLTNDLKGDVAIIFPVSVFCARAVLRVVPVTV